MIMIDRQFLEWITNNVGVKILISELANHLVYISHLLFPSQLSYSSNTQLHLVPFLKVMTFLSLRFVTHRNQTNNKDGQRKWQGS